jgi:hypothetical protein
LVERQAELQPADVLLEGEVVVVLPVVEAGEDPCTTPAAWQEGHLEARGHIGHIAWGIINVLEAYVALDPAEAFPVQARRTDGDADAGGTVDAVQILGYGAADPWPLRF